MAVNPVTSPVPQNSNFSRAMFVNLASNPIDTDQHLQALLNFCSNNGCNTVFMDFYSYLGASNWTSSHLTRMQTTLDNMHKSGIKVYAYSGDISWTYSQQWVMKNILLPLVKYQNLATLVTHRFDGAMMDVEYWADNTQAASVACPQLCELGQLFKEMLGLPVGAFVGWFLKDNSSTRAAFAYQGKTAQDGEFLVDNFDFVAVGSYRNHAADNGTDGIGQINMIQPWFDYAQSVSKGVYGGSECQNLSPSYQDYYGMGKTAMEAQHTLISQAFITTASVSTPCLGTYLGQAIDEYASWAAMGT
jgi:hypothetical protein